MSRIKRVAYLIGATKVEILRNSPYAQQTTPVRCLFAGSRRVLSSAEQGEFPREFLIGHLGKVKAVHLKTLQIVIQA
jgi:hypothetical protein